MQIGELARRGGVSVQTIRYYERCGLLQSPQRKPSRYRVYGEKDIYQLRFIRQAKGLGFSLDEIKHLFELRETETCPCDEVLRIGEERLAQLQSEIMELSRFHDHLARAVKSWKKCPAKAPGDGICILIERTHDGRNQ